MAICLTNYVAHMNILFIIKVNILVLIEWSYRSPKIMLTTEPRMVSIYWAHRPICFEHMSFWCSFLDPHPTHIPLNYRCPDYCYVWVRHVYLRLLCMRDTSPLIITLNSYGYLGHVSGASLWDKRSCLLLSEVVSIGISRIELKPDNLIIGI